MASKTKVYAGNVNSRVTESDAHRLFERYGPIRKLELKVGYAFVDYEDVRDADDAVTKLHNYDFMGSRLNVELSRGPRVHGVASGPPPNRSGGYRAICENIPPSSNWQDMKDFARKSGNVTYADVWTDYASGKKMGVIEFHSKDELSRAIRDLNRRDLNGYEVILYEQNSEDNGRERWPDRRSPPRRERPRSPPRYRDEGRDNRDRGPPRGPPPREYGYERGMGSSRSGQYDDRRERERGYSDRGYGGPPDRGSSRSYRGDERPVHRGGSPPRRGQSPPRGGAPSRAFGNGGRLRSPPPREFGNRGLSPVRRQEPSMRERSPPLQRQHLRDRLVAERKAREEADGPEGKRPDVGGTPSPSSQ